ncbi:hypothetical protein NVV94_04750 [Pseudomonas sp. LS1212]|uniref:hypothetical protein n=1 Tax=Pseudomonas sp. LS1212 TaxID=2972478 RepID=UPI00215CE4B3|nr:hypothetical protein [Pseudomonas sp. LS1212]UVJ44896.1 hypothetical protein NVV94_04750 [Pseudomonas sp. LS1212]
MKNDIDSFFAEIQKKQGPWKAIYNKCLSVQEKYKPRLLSHDYAFNINKIMAHYENGLSTSATAWCIITLCQLKTDIVNTTNIANKNTNNQNPLDRDLLIALNLPGEHLDEGKIIWRSLRDDFSFNTSRKLNNKLLKELRSHFSETLESYTTLNSIKRHSSIYCDLFSLFIHLMYGEHNPEGDLHY